MSETTPFTLEVAPGTAIHGVVDLPEASGPRPAVIICHGFKGFMDWGFFPYLAALLAARGFTVIRFNFSGSGMEPGGDRATDLEGFRESSFSGDLRDLLAVLEAAPSLAPGRVNPQRLGLIGHSRGGGCALLGSAHETWQGRIRALVTWASVSTFDRFGEEIKSTWRRTGEILVPNSRTGQQLPLGLATLNDVEENREALDLAAAAGRRRAPWLILHGSEDETVPVAEAKALEAAAADPAVLEILTGAGHTFDCRHPFAGPTPALTTAMNHTQTWFRRHL
ncbi:MAG: alpha/beta fold hydrolase [Acidobacteria bacterium]|nr:alpha/beta fold hydrolase [Acidobacteriota bacterium]